MSLLKRGRILWIGCVTLFFIFVFAACCNAQVGSGSGLWKWNQHAEHHETVSTLHNVTNNRFSSTVAVKRIGKSKRHGQDGQIVLWAGADHGIGSAFDTPDMRILIKHRSHTYLVEAEIVARDSEYDVCILKSWVPDGFPVASLSKSKVKANDNLEIVGYGGDPMAQLPRRSHNGNATRAGTGTNWITIDAYAIGGDSGCGVFKDDGLCGLISWGMVKTEKQVTNTLSLKQAVRGPIVAVALKPILSLLAQAEKIHAAAGATDGLTRQIAQQDVGPNDRAGAAAAPKPTPAFKIQSYAEAYKDAERNDRPLLVIVGAKWCVPCQLQKLELKHFADASIAYVDVDQESALANALGYRKGETKLPWLILYPRSNGEFIPGLTRHGFQTAKRAKEWIQSQKKK